METSSKKNLTIEQTNALINDLLDKSSICNGERRLARGAVQECSKKFEITPSQVYRIWRAAQQSRKNNGRYHLSPRKKGRSGRKTMYDSAEVDEAVESVDPQKRGTIRGLADSLGLSYTTTWRLIKEQKAIVTHSSSIKPMLTEHHKLVRLLYAVDRVESMENGTLVYNSGKDEVHIDEKWFDLTPEVSRVYITPFEKEHQKIQRNTRHKSHIVKVMFLAAVARPRFNDDGECVFDGKIGIWPFVHKVPAKRTSVNRPRGTIETKTLSVTKEVYEDFLVNKVIPAIHDKFLHSRLREKDIVYIQHDNPNTHRVGELFKEACDGHNRISIQLKEQPANSPDTNVLDLGLFRALQSNAWKLKRASNIDGLIDQVTETWDAYDPTLLDRVWFTHQTVLDAIIKDNGGNNFDIPHVGKGVLQRNHNLPDHFPVSEGARAVLDDHRLI